MVLAALESMEALLVLVYRGRSKGMISMWKECFIVDCGTCAAPSLYDQPSTGHNNAYRTLCALGDDTVTIGHAKRRRTRLSCLRMG